MSGGAATPGLETGVGPQVASASGAGGRGPATPWREALADRRQGCDNRQACHVVMHTPSAQFRNRSPRPFGLSLAVILGVALARHTPAQVHHNEVIRFGTTDLVQSQVHPTTGYNLEMPGAQPGAYMAVGTAGVPAGTLTWVWYPGQQNARYEDRYVTGHMIGVRPSTSTPITAYSIVHPGQPAQQPTRVLHRRTKLLHSVNELQCLRRLENAQRVLPNQAACQQRRL